MRRSVIGVCVNGDFIEGIPYVYNGSEWIYAAPTIYQANWLEIGGKGALFYNFLEKDNKDVIDYNTAIFSVTEDREHKVLKDTNGNFIKAKDTKVTVDTGKIPQLQIRVR